MNRKQITSTNTTYNRTEDFILNNSCHIHFILSFAKRIYDCVAFQACAQAVSNICANIFFLHSRILLYKLSWWASPMPCSVGLHTISSCSLLYKCSCLQCLLHAKANAASVRPWTMQFSIHYTVLCYLHRCVLGIDWNKKEWFQKNKSSICHSLLFLPSKHLVHVQFCLNPIFFFCNVKWKRLLWSTANNRLTSFVRYDSELKKKIVIKYCENISFSSSMDHVILSIWKTTSFENDNRRLIYARPLIGKKPNFSSMTMINWHPQNIISCFLCVRNIDFVCRRKLWLVIVMLHEALLAPCRHTHADRGCVYVNDSLRNMTNALAAFLFWHESC